MTDTDPISCARAAAEALRALNHATLHRTGYTWPADVHAVITELHLGTQRMPQALRQAREWLQNAHSRAQVGLDQDGDPDTVLNETASALNTAIRDACMLSQTLADVQTLTSHLTGVIPPAGSSMSDG